LNIKLLVMILMGLAVTLTGCSGSHKMEQSKQEKLAKLHYQMGLDALHKNQLPKAFDELMMAEKLSPDMPENLDTLAYAWRLRGNLKQSEVYYKKAIRAGSGSISHTNYGGLLIELERYKEAKEHLLKALEDPRYHGQYIATILLGDALFGLKEYEEAINSYRQAGLMSPNQTITRLKEARAFTALQRRNIAKALYETILRDEPNNRTALEGLLEIFAVNNDKQSARLQLQNFIGQPSVSKLDRAWATDELVKLR